MAQPNSEIDLRTEELYSTADTVEYLDQFEDTKHVHASQTGDVSFVWTGRNRIEVLKHLLAHGWAVTSMDDGFIWVEPVGEEVEEVEEQ